MTLIIIKIVVSIITVVSLAEISKRINPVLGGVLLGLPLGAGLSVYFISYEQGIPFLLAGIPWAIAGLASSILFCLAYWFTGLHITAGKLKTIACCSLAAISVFFASGAFIRGLDMNLAGAMGLFAAVAAFNLLVMRRAPALRNEKAPKPLSIQGLLLRGLITGIIITAVTIVAPLAGSRWAGILSSFPSTLYALLVIVHYDSGNDLYPAIIKSFAYSVTTLAVFYLSCLWIMPQYGLNTGFIIVYILAAVYLYITHNAIVTLSKHGVRH